MRTFIDITTIHRIGQVLDSRPNDKISDNDVVGVFHLAEHIMFSDSIVFASFDKAQISNVTYEAINNLNRNECLPKSDELNFLNGKIQGKIIGDKLFDSSNYKSYCDDASLRVADMLNGWLNRNIISTVSTLINSSSRPKHSTLDDVSNLTSLNEPLKIREEIALEQLEKKKADAAVKYMLLTSDQLREQLKKMEKSKGPFSNLENEVLRVILRMEINQCLAEGVEARYAPAPQRAVAEELLDRSFREHLNRVLLDAIKDKRKQKKIYNGLFERLASNEILPLPMLAIGKLRQKIKKNVGPIQLLKEAALLRQSKEIKRVRKWLNDWEEADKTGNFSKQEKSAKEIEDIEKMLRIDVGLEQPKSILRASFESISAILRGDIPNIGELKEVQQSIKDKQMIKRPSKAFLSLIARNLGGDRYLGKWIIEVINRIIK